jgi:hypothetical protein
MIVKLIGAAAAALAIAGLAAACSSSSTTSGTETFTSGKVTSAKVLEAKTTILPLKWTGPVGATGSINLTGPAPAKGQTHTFITSKGNMVALVTAKPTMSETWTDKATCLAKMVTGVVYTVDGAKSTGSFKGASGSGTVTVTFQFNSELNGKCSMASNAAPTTLTGAYGEFTGIGPLTVKS